MKAGNDNKELDLWVQIAALSSLWVLWLLTALLVVCRELSWEGRQFYDDRLTVYSLVLVVIPLVLIVIGMIFLRRVGRMAYLSPIQRVFYCFVGLAVSAGATLVLLFCSAWLLGALDQVRE
jgi:hypothetical protein